MICDLWPRNPGRGRVKIIARLREVSDVFCS